jgi:hypothetical protein
MSTIKHTPKVPFQRTILAGILVDVAVLFAFFVLRAVLMSGGTGNENDHPGLYITLTVFGHASALFAGLYTMWPHVRQIKGSTFKRYAPVMLGLIAPHVVYRALGSGLSTVDCDTNCAPTILQQHYQDVASLITTILFALTALTVAVVLRSRARAKASAAPKHR